jgi:hypothetical protein
VSALQADPASYTANDTLGATVDPTGAYASDPLSAVTGTIGSDISNVWDYLLAALAAYWWVLLLAGIGYLWWEHDKRHHSGGKAAKSE